MEEYDGYGVGSSSTSPSWFDLCELEKKSTSLGFMELLQQHDHYTIPPHLLHLHDHDDSALKEQQQPPSTTNSSSISSASSEVAPLHDEHEHHNHHNKSVDQPPPQVQQHQNATNKPLKAKKTNQKRQKEPRFAFMTKSEVDHLEDGFRWRKYGQKAVKNSPFPRSYYRCTSGSCSVKKRVERSLTDPSVVVTTYEGQHTHPSPTMARSGGHHKNQAIAENYLSQYYYDQQQLSHQQQQLLFWTLSSSLGFPPSSFSQERPPVCSPGGINNNALLLRDHGLLQDVVPSHMLKEED